MVEQNRLLRCLSESDRSALAQERAVVQLPRKTVLLASGSRPAYGYFLLSGLASIITEMAEGTSAEVSMVGNEGVIGALHLLGPGKVPTTCIMQLDGTGIRVPWARMQQMYSSHARVRDLLLECVQEQTNVISQIAGCSRLHEAEERLARWLLMAQDRTGMDVLNFTQEFMADLLGARRTTVTVVAGALQRKGLIDYHRGSVRIVDRAALELAACSCYAVTRRLLDSLFTNPPC